MNEGTKDVLWIIVIVGGTVLIILSVLFGGYNDGYSRGYCDALGGTRADDRSCIVGGEHVEMKK